MIPNTHDPTSTSFILSCNYTMGKKRVTYGFNDEDDKPPNNVPIDHHHHHHHHRHHNNQKPKKIKSEAKLLHTLNSHLKKLAKYRSKNLISLSSPPPVNPAINVFLENNKNNRDHLSCWLTNDHDKDDFYDWFMDFDYVRDDGCDMGVFEFSQDLFLKASSSFIGSEDNEDLFGGDYVFGPDLNASYNMVVVFEEFGLGYGSYIPDPIVNWDDVDEGKHLYDMLKLSSQEDMINEFLKVNLFVAY
ncbi:hypothetical protein QVD17_36922 [Tagetes erecta]|uniref:Uncharacterized protein n=1 Tax=Tagetes erecta TaxID=13708 RepID=A0AAD8NCA6_TARER|nr:hypothetical protein QVD17_36922 [Tagetes erecta]